MTCFLVLGGGEGLSCRASGRGMQGARCRPGGGVQRDPRNYSWAPRTWRRADVQCWKHLQSLLYQGFPARGCRVRVFTKHSEWDQSDNEALKYFFCVKDMVFYWDPCKEHPSLFEDSSFFCCLFTWFFFLSFRKYKDQLKQHIAHKKVPCVDMCGNHVTPTRPNGIKLEKFVFDVFPFSRYCVFSFMICCFYYT